MGLKSQFAMDDVRAMEGEIARQMEQAHRAAMLEWSDGLKGDLRDDVIAAGLGERLAKTWRGRVYPDKMVRTLDPAGVVYVTPGKGRSGSAPMIIDYHSAERVVVPVVGEGLAIPTKAVPRRRGRGFTGAMSPLEVERFFNAKLIPRKLDGGGMGLFINVVPGLHTLKGGYRPATKKRVASGRKERLVLMFVLRRSVKGRKRLDHQAIFMRWASRFPQIVDNQARLAGLE